MCHVMMCSPSSDGLRNKIQMSGMHNRFFLIYLPLLIFLVTDLKLKVNSLNIVQSWKVYCIQGWVNKDVSKEVFHECTISSIWHKLWEAVKKASHCWFNHNVWKKTHNMGWVVLVKLLTNTKCHYFRDRKCIWRTVHWQKAAVISREWTKVSQPVSFPHSAAKKAHVWTFLLISNWTICKRKTFLIFCRQLQGMCIWNFLVGLLHRAEWLWQGASVPLLTCTLCLSDAPYTTIAKRGAGTSLASIDPLMFRL